MVNAQMFREMVLAAANLLEQNKENLDALNVFPVPDGDTGTNMSLTMLSAAKQVNELNTNKVGEIVHALSQGALRGARGNSGVILSQLFRGYATAIEKDKESIEPRDLARAMEQGIQAAYKAVMRPKEGTILTVANAMAEAAKRCTYTKSSIPQMLDAVLEQGAQTLNKTPEMLPVLKEAGVVDAGGAGLLTIYKAFKMAIDGEKIEYILDFSAPKQQIGVQTADISTGDIEFGYCTEFFIKNLHEDVDQARIDAFRDGLMKIGDCVLVVGDPELVKVHVHTNMPGSALQRALQLGELSKIKIDNMREQHNEIINSEGPSAPISAASAEQKEIGTIAVAAGEGVINVFKDLGIDYMVEGGQSMNPSAEDIERAIDCVPAKTIIVLPNNKNIILAAQQASTMTSKNVMVVPSKSIPQGISAILAFDEEKTPEENEQKMTRALADVKTGSVTTAVRDTTLNGSQIAKGDFIGLLEGDIVVDTKDLMTSTLELLAQMVDEDSSVITVFAGQEVSEETEQTLKGTLEEKFDMCDVEVVRGDQPIYHFIISVE